MTLWKQLHCIDDHALTVTALVGDANPVVVAGIEAEEKVRKKQCDILLYAGHENPSLEHTASAERRQKHLHLRCRR